MKKSKLMVLSVLTALLLVSITLPVRTNAAELKGDSLVGEHEHLDEIELAAIVPDIESIETLDPYIDVVSTASDLLNTVKFDNIIVDGLLVSVPTGEEIEPDAQIDIMFNVINEGTVQQTVSITPQWSKVVRYVTVPADSKADITVSYPVTKTVDYGGTALNLDVLVEVGEQSKMFSYDYTVKKEPTMTLVTYLGENVIPVIGQAVTITTNVTNTGNVPLHNLIVTHTVLGDVQLKAPELLPGANKLFNSRVLVSADMIINGNFTNVSTLVSDEAAAEPFVYSSSFDGELSADVIEDATASYVETQPQPTVATEDSKLPVALENTESVMPKALDMSVAEMPKTGMDTLFITTIIPIGLIIFSLVSVISFMLLGRKKKKGV